MDGSDPPTSGQAGAERKLVTVLVCEVGEPTAAAGECDLEDRDRLLAGALTGVQAEVARHGGLVVEVIGDVVVAVFGVPRTRDDDAERAVLAALASRVRLASSSVDAGRVRVAVASDQALVSPGEPAAGRGWGISGEVVVAAMAVKDTAPPGAVLVTAATLQATQRAVSYAPARLLPLAGASEPVPLWDALAPRPRSGRTPPLVLGAELVGRDGELAVLLDRYERIRGGGGPQLVTLVGPAGIGKSRLLAELGRRVVGEPAPPAWRTGRAQPNVDGGTFGALVEVAKAEAGILDGDQAATAERKLSDAITRVLEGPTAGWVTRQLRPLVGAGVPAAASGGGVERGEDVVAAWRWWLRAVADRQPLVLAVEDLHWADQLLLDVLDGVADPALVGAAPLLVVVTARPELLDRHPGWDRQHPNRTIVRLGPLPTVDTTRLLRALLATHGVAAAIQPDLLARVDGNPLFAEEYARLLRDRRGPAEGLPVPATVHGVIAARLDALPPGDKAVLANAAVLGQVGWVGAIAAVGGHDPADLDAWLDLNRSLGVLERRELLRRVAGSRVAGEVEVAFRHVLVRDVAYAQLPRAVRADRHQRAAAWLEQLAPDRTSDRAELLAYHYTQALTSARAAGQPTGRLVDQARRALREAGDHAIALGTHVTAARYYTQALELWPEDDPERPDLALRAGEARCRGEGTGEDLLEQARDGLLAAGARERAAEAEALLGRLAWLQGRPRSAHIQRALALVADAPPSRSKLVVLSGCMQHLMVAGQHTEAFEVAHQALVMASSFGARDMEAAAIGVIGAAQIDRGDPSGLADLERCVERCEELGSSMVIGWHMNLAHARSILGDLRGSFAARQAAWRAAQRYGAVDDLRYITLQRVAEHYWSGRWDQALQIAETAVADVGGARYYMECECRIWRGRIRLANGEVDAALQDGTRALELAREAGDAQNLDPALAFGARALLAAGRVADAGKLVNELLERLRGRMLHPDLGVDLAVDLTALGRLPGNLDHVRPSPWVEAARTFVAGNPAQAAKIYTEIGSRPDAAYARLQAARSLIAAGHPTTATTELALVRAFYREVHAHAYLAEADALT